MPHKSRAGRRKNATRLKTKRAKVKKSLAEAIAGASRVAVERRYPHPPRYWDGVSKTKPVQPLCYGWLR